jgi:hypothetical protein
MKDQLKVGYDCALADPAGDFLQSKSESMCARIFWKN